VSAIADLLSSLPADACDRPVQQVWVGLYWTAVHSQCLGLAATPHDVSCCFAEDVSGVGRLQERTAGQLAALLRSTHPLEVSIGMAALNSLITVDAHEEVELNARALMLERGRGKRVATIGHFPFTDALRQVAAQLWVFELHPAPGDQPADAAPQLLPQADVIGLTASTLLNGTFESLSELFPPEALVVMLGPSTPLSRVLFDYRVDVLAGARVHDPAAALHYVGQGSSLHRVPGLARVTLVNPLSRAWGGHP